MKLCKHCNFSNPEGAKFCSNCGGPLSLNCTNCAAELAPGAKFCSNCGQAQAESAQAAPVPQPAAQPAQTSPAPTSGNLEKYIPAELLEKLEAARNGGSAQEGALGERRIVTMLFCDIQGSTAAAGKLDPEEWHEIVNGTFEHMIAPIYKYEGTIARLMGDGVLAFFGAPIAHEDDPQRAVLASLEILEGIETYRQKIIKEWDIDVKVRVGINTGLVVVGGVGSDLRMEYTALGDAINLAARMEQTAQPGTIQISEDTHRLVAPIFSFEDLGGVEVKGKLEPVQAYRVLGIKMQPGQIRGIEGLDAPLIGRAAEMETLRALMAKVYAGQGQITSIMGEAGLGKSRLLSELRKLPPPAAGKKSKLLWLEGRSLSYETSTPYAPFLDLFSQHFGLDAHQTDDERHKIIKKHVAKVAADQMDAIVPFLASMLDVALTGEDGERIRYLTPPQLRQGVYQAVCTYIERLALQDPLAVVIDDVHWIDPTSLDLLSHLLPLAEKVPLLIILLFRPRRDEPSWQIHETAARDYAHRYHAISLQPLNKESSRQLVANLLEVDDLPQSVRTMIMDKAEGNPFYVEEVIRSLLDSGLIIRVDDHWQTTREITNITVPDTLSAVIMTRLDRLDEKSRQAAQTASVFGRQFQYKLLEEVHNIKEPLEPILDDLQRRELIREKSRLPQHLYLFKHSLTQETVYSSMLLKKRRELHKSVAESLEKNEPERVNELARHFFEAREYARALPYLVEAGSRAAKAYSTQEAIQLFAQAIELLEKTDEDIPLARRAFEGLGGTLEFAFDFPKAAETYQQMIEFGETHADIPMQVSAKNKLAKTVGMGMAQFERALELLSEAEQLARQVDDMPGLAEGSMIQCAFCTAQADFDGAVSFLGQAVEIGQLLEEDIPRLYGLTHIANTYTYMGLFDEAWKTIQEAKALAEETGNRQYMAELMTFSMPFNHFRNGEIEQARQTTQEGVQIASQIGSIPSDAIGNYFLGYLAQLEGQYEDALTHYQNALEISSGSIPYLETVILCLMGSTYLEIGSVLKDKVLHYHDQAEDLLDSHPMAGVMGSAAWAELGFCALAVDKLDLARSLFDQGLSTPTAMMHLSRPKLLLGSAFVNLAENQIDAACESIEEAQSYIEARQMKHEAPAASLAMGKVCFAEGQFEKALECFTHAEEAALALGFLPVVWQAQAYAARALQQMNLDEQAQEKQDQALETIDGLKGLFENQELRAAFENSAMRELNVSFSQPTGSN